MGNECRKPFKLKYCADNLNIVDMFKESSDPAELTERKIINSVTIFSTHTTPMNKQRCITNPNVKVDSNETPKSTITETDCILAGPKKKHPSTPINCSHTLKGCMKQHSVSLEASRFILEQKKSMWDKYEVISNLGKGSFGEVLLIRNKDTKVQRALKIVSKSKCKTMDSFIEEIKILKELVTFI